MNSNDGFKIVGGITDNSFLSRVCKHLNQEPIKAEFHQFPDGEISVTIEESVRGDIIYVLYSKGANVNDELIKLMILARTLKSSSAKRLVLIMPYMPYCRQDKKLKSREPISARYVMDLFKMSRFDHIIALDLHNPSIQGFTDIPVDNFTAAPLFIKYIKQCNIDSDKLMIISPDAGGVKRARNLSDALDADLAICYKERKRASEIADMKLLGNVVGKECYIVDDMVDTCGTLLKACELLKENGATKVHAIVVHGILSGDALGKLESDLIDSIVVTNSVDVEMKTILSNKIKVIDISNMMANAIRRNFKNKSSKPLFSPHTNSYLELASFSEH